MTSIEKPLYVVAFGADYVGTTSDPKHGMTCFGTKADAEKFARDFAKENHLPAAMGRVIQYNFSGKVCEV